MVVSHLLSVCEPGQQTDEDGDDLVLDRASDVAVGASKGVSERADNVGAFAAWVAATLGADELGDVFEGDVVGLAQRRESIQVSGEVGATACNPTRYVYPVPGGSNGGPHAGYPAADIFKGNRVAGATVVAPVAGTVTRIDRVDDWSAATDRPRARGGRTVSIRDADGVRHYLAHFRSIRRDVVPGGTVRAGQALGSMGGDGQGERLPHALRHQPTVPQSRMVGAQGCRRAAALSRRLAARHRHESEARYGFGGRSTRTPALIRA